jgi:hypothetical protein
VLRRVYDPVWLDLVLANGPAESLAPRAATMAQLTKGLLDSAATGERDPERLTQFALSTVGRD